MANKNSYFKISKGIPGLFWSALFSDEICLKAMCGKPNRLKTKEFGVGVTNRRDPWLSYLVHSKELAVVLARLLLTWARCGKFGRIWDNGFALQLCSHLIHRFDGSICLIRQDPGRLLDPVTKAHADHDKKRSLSSVLRMTTMPLPGWSQNSTDCQRSQ